MDPGAFHFISGHDYVKISCDNNPRRSFFFAALGWRDCTVEVALEKHSKSKGDPEALRCSLEKKSKAVAS